MKIIVIRMKTGNIKKEMSDQEIVDGGADRVIISPFHSFQGIEPEWGLEQEDAIILSNVLIRYDSARNDIEKYGVRVYRADTKKDMLHVLEGLKEKGDPIEYVANLYDA